MCSVNDTNTSSDRDALQQEMDQLTSEIDRMLRFRDWLRTNDADRDKYAQVKRNLAKNKWRHVQHYADAKTSIIQKIMERASLNLENGIPEKIFL